MLGASAGLSACDALVSEAGAFCSLSCALLAERSTVLHIILVYIR